MPVSVDRLYQVNALLAVALVVLTGSAMLHVHLSSPSKHTHQGNSTPTPISVRTTFTGVPHGRVLLCPQMLWTSGRVAAFDIKVCKSSTQIPPQAAVDATTGIVMPIDADSLVGIAEEEFVYISMLRGAFPVIQLSEHEGPQISANVIVYDLGVPSEICGDQWCNNQCHDASPDNLVWPTNSVLVQAEVFNVSVTQKSASIFYQNVTEDTAFTIFSTWTTPEAIVPPDFAALEAETFFLYGSPCIAIANFGKRTTESILVSGFYWYTDETTTDVIVF